MLTQSWLSSGDWWAAPASQEPRVDEIRGRGGDPHGGTDVTTPATRHTWATQSLREPRGNHTHVTLKPTRSSESAPLCALEMPSPTGREQHPSARSPPHTDTPLDTHSARPQTRNVTELAYLPLCVLTSAAIETISPMPHVNPPPPTESRHELNHAPECPDPYATAPRADRRRPSAPSHVPAPPRPLQETARRLPHEQHASRPRQRPKVVAESKIPPRAAAYTCCARLGITSR